jgi:hypothetical protein
MPVRWRRGTEEDLAKLPTLVIAFGPKKPQPEPDEDEEATEDE